ncbi:MAG: aldehyde dehydrogenase family protein, partial [Burkholderiaceae bacterium]|nr:aldehyde dehydrogenase family protein [Burkholderiaceae bacterium]
MSTEAARPASTAGRPSETQLFIGGRWSAASDGGTFQVLNPAREELLANVAAAKPDDIDAAVRAARAQFDGGEWSRMDGAERGRLLYRLAELMERDKDYIAMLETLNLGRPLMEPTVLDLPMAIGTVRYF